MVTVYLAVILYAYSFILIFNAPRLQTLVNPRYTCVMVTLVVSYVRACVCVCVCICVCDCVYVSVCPLLICHCRLRGGVMTERNSGDCIFGCYTHADPLVTSSPRSPLHAIILHEIIEPSVSGRRACFIAACEVNTFLCLGSYVFPSTY